VVPTSGEASAEAGIRDVEGVRRQERPLIRYSPELLTANRQLRKYLYANMYYHPRVHDLQEAACGMLERVFESYLKAPGLLGELHAARMREEGLHRTVCDYIAGMTDRYLIEAYRRFYPDQPLPAAFNGLLVWNRAGLGGLTE